MAITRCPTTVPHYSQLIAGVRFRDGEAVTNPGEQAAA